MGKHGEPRGRGGEGLAAKGFDSILRAIRNHGPVLNKEEFALD